MSRRGAHVRAQRVREERNQAPQRLATHRPSRRGHPDRHRLSWLIGGGLLGGLALAILPPKRWAQAGALLLGGGARRLMRSALAPALLGALWMNRADSRTAARATTAGDGNRAPPRV